MIEHPFQYIHKNNDNNHLTLLDDDPQILSLNNQPLLDFIFKEDRIYYITFAVKSRAKEEQSFNVKLINLENNQSEEKLIKSFKVPANDKGILKYCSCLFSPTSQNFNRILWENLIFKRENQECLKDVKIYQVHRLNFFENQQDGLIRQIIKISIEGTPGTLVSINGETWQISDKTSKLQLSHGSIVTSVGVASIGEFTIDFTYLQ